MKHLYLSWDKVGMDQYKKFQKDFFFLFQQLTLEKIWIDLETKLECKKFQANFLFWWQAILNEIWKDFAILKYILVYLIFQIETNKKIKNQAAGFLRMYEK